MDEQYSLQNRVVELENKVQFLTDYIMHQSTQDTFSMRRNMTIQGNATFDTLNSKGNTTIGSDTSTLSFFGATPTTQQPAITKPVGGATVDTECRTAVNDLIDVVQGLGFTL